jgi:hypothetical protein
MCIASRSRRGSIECLSVFARVLERALQSPAVRCHRGLGDSAVGHKRLEGWGERVNSTAASSVRSWSM